MVFNMLRALKKLFLVALSACIQESLMTASLTLSCGPYFFNECLLKETVESLLSGTEMVSNMVPQSSAVSAIGPTLSKDQLNVMAPYLLTLPNVGLSPATPQYEAGESIEPQVSVPIAKGTIPDPTAEPDPLDDPPAHLFLFHGLRQGPVRDALG